MVAAALKKVLQHFEQGCWEIVGSDVYPNGGEIGCSVETVLAKADVSAILRFDGTLGFIKYGHLQNMGIKNTDRQSQPADRAWTQLLKTHT